MEIVEVLATNRADAMFVKNSTAVNVRVFDMIDHRQMDLFVGIVQIEDSKILLCDVSLWHVTSLRASLHMYGFDYSSAHYQ